MNINLSLGTNWKTTIGGVLAGLPTIVIASFMAYNVKVSPLTYALLSIASGVGMLLTGVSAKDSTTHSTIAQVEQSTSQDAAAKGVAPPAVPLK